jgi:hypothetical protein
MTDVRQKTDFNQFFYHFRTGKDIKRLTLVKTKSEYIIKNRGQNSRESYTEEMQFPLIPD